MASELQRLISSIPEMYLEDFDLLTEAVQKRFNNPLPPMTEEQWAEKLDHSISQAQRGEYSDADEVIARIRAEHYAEMSG